MLSSIPVAASVEAQNIRYDVNVEKRYFLGEKIPAAFSITNIGPRIVKVKDAAMLKISMGLKGFIEKGVAPGVYTLTVWFDDRARVTKKFRVEVDGERTYERLLQMLRTGDETTMNWASYYMLKIDEKRTLSIARQMLESGNESERYWALTVLGSRGHIKF